MARNNPQARIGRWIRRMLPQENMLDDLYDAAQEIIDRPLSPIASSLTALSGLLALIVAVSLVTFKTGVFAVADGRIQPIGRSKVVQAAVAGVIESVMVSDGDNIKQGQVIIRLNPTLQQANLDGLVESADELRAEIIRRNFVKLMDLQDSSGAYPKLSFPPSIPLNIAAQETGVMDADIDRLRTDILLQKSRAAEANGKNHVDVESVEAEQKIISILEHKVSMRQALEEQGWGSRADLMDSQEALEREREEIVEHKADSIVQAQVARSAEDQSLQDVALYKEENAKGIIEAQVKLTQTVEDITKARYALRSTVVRAPSGGSVQELVVTTPGQSVSAAEQLAVIVPNAAPVEALVLVENKDIGFVRVGQPVTLKIDSYPFERFGVVRGAVEIVSHDAIARSSQDTYLYNDVHGSSAHALDASPTPHVSELVFPVIVRLSGPANLPNRPELKLSPGMSLHAQIETSRRSLLSYIVGPIAATIRDSGHER